MWNESPIGFLWHLTEISARKELLKNKNRCFNYLAFGNIVKNCTKNSKCFTCNEKHNVSIYEKKISESKIKPNGPDVPTALDVPTMSNIPFYKQQLEILVL